MLNLICVRAIWYAEDEVNFFLLLLAPCLFHKGFSVTSKMICWNLTSKWQSWDFKTCFLTPVHWLRLTKYIEMFALNNALLPNDESWKLRLWVHLIVRKLVSTGTRKCLESKYNLIWLMGEKEASITEKRVQSCWGDQLHFTYLGSIKIFEGSVDFQEYSFLHDSEIYNCTNC